MPEYRREDIRELLERPYRIIYRATPDRVTILTVMHFWQLLPHKVKNLQHVPKN